MKEKEQIARGQEVLDRVYQHIGDEMNLIETNVSDAIRRAGRAMSPDGENYLAAGADLAEFLISDEPICRGTKLMLAQLVLGELRRPNKKPSVHASHPKVVEAVAMFDRLVSEGCPINAAEHEVWQKLRVKRSTLFDYRTLVREREEAISSVKARLGHPK